VRSRVLGPLLVAAAIAYLWPFVPRGWVPHDEGMIGQSADLVLHGAVPHLDYVEPYTGGLTYVYAALFRTTGIDLFNVRRLMFVVAAATSWLLYLIAWRRLGPLAAAVAVWVAISCSFPIYFAGVPSWWLLLCAMVELWGMVRWSESRSMRHLLLAAAAAGVGVVIKQTGVYLVVAAGLWALYDGGARRADTTASLDRAARWVAGGAALIFAAVMLAPRLLAAEGLYLFAPVAATAIVLFAPRTDAPRADAWRSPTVLTLLAASVAAVPLVVLLVPYVRYHGLAEFVSGVIVLPQKRLAFASMGMPGGAAIVNALPVVALIAAASALATRRWALALLWAAAVMLPLAATRYAFAYQLIWEAGRALAALIPIVLAWLVLSGRVADPRERSVVFAVAAVLAWASLNQYPFSAPIYFAYTVPLVVIGAVTAAGAISQSATGVLLPIAVLFGAFGIAIANRGDLYTLGHFDADVRLRARLNLPRAHLTVSDRDARVYRLLVSSIDSHLHGGTLIAGPDCPEVYFLAGLRSPSGTLFDFFSESEPDDAARWLKGDVIVLNHQPEFSHPPSDRVVDVLRREFVWGDQFGRFEIRWR
jgi:hypothetical protein